MHRLRSNTPQRCPSSLPKVAAGVHERGFVVAVVCTGHGQLLNELVLVLISGLCGVHGQLGLVCGGLEGIEGVGAGAFDVAAGGLELVGEALVLVLGGLVAQLGELDLLRRADVGVALGYGLLQLLLRAGDLAAAARPC